MGAWFRWIKKLYENLFEKLEGLKAGFPGIGTTYFVDAGSGVDTNTGLAPDKALLTLAAALAKCVDGHDDVIIARGNFTDSAITITKSKVHLKGLRDGRGLGYLTRINPGASATGATILIQAEDVEIANLQVIGHRDPGFNYPAIFADGVNGGTRAHIHDCFVTGVMTPDGTHYHNGIELSGDRHVVEHCVIDQQKIGVRVYESGDITTYEILILANIFSGCDVGVDIFATSEATGRHGVFVNDNTFDAQGALAEDRAIKVQAGGGTPTLARNYIAGYTTPITTGSAKLIMNYESSAAGGVLIAA